jgi:hypothetical protein
MGRFHISFPVPHKLIAPGWHKPLNNVAQTPAPLAGTPYELIGEWQWN